MKKKFMMFMVLTIIPILILIGCGPKQDEVVKIWAWNKNVDILNEALERYQEIDNNFLATIEPFAQNDIDKKYTTSSQLKDGTLIGDIVLADAMKIRGYHDSWEELFVDFSKYGVNDEEQAKFVQSTVDLITDKDKMFAMPFGIAPTVVFAYTPLWEEDVLDKVINDGWTWEEYKSIGLDIKLKQGEDVYMTSYNMRQDDRIYRTMVSQKGQWFMDKNLNVLVNNDISVSSMVRTKDFYDSKILGHIDTGDYKAQMKNGKIAAQIQGFFLGGQLKDVAPETTGKWRILPLPKFEDMNRSDSITGGSYFYVNNTINDSKKKKAVEFIKWLTLEEENSIKSLDVGGIYPALKTSYELDEFKNKTDAFFNNQKTLFDVSEYTKFAPTIYPSKYNAFNYDAYILEQENIIFNNANILESLDRVKKLMEENAKK